MSAFIGPALLEKLVADKAGKTIEEASVILAAYNTVVGELLARGARVRVLDKGYFEVIKTKATRRKSPMVAGSGYVKIPAKKKIVFRESRKK